MKKAWKSPGGDKRKMMSSTEASCWWRGGEKNEFTFFQLRWHKQLNMFWFVCLCLRKWRPSSGLKRVPTERTSAWNDARAQIGIIFPSQPLTLFQHLGLCCQPRYQSPKDKTLLYECLCRDLWSREEESHWLCWFPPVYIPGSYWPVCHS